MSAGPFGGPKLSAGATRQFDVPQSACNIPSSAVAYSLNVTVIPDASLNYLTIWPSGEAQPVVSTLNSDGRVKANAAITPAGSNGGVSVFATDATQVILDIDGYFVPEGTASALAFYPVTPCRIADTRQPTGPLGGPFISGGTSRDFSVQSSSCNLPPTAQAYSLNVTALPHTTLNYLTIWPTGVAQPNASTLNASTGTVTANAALVSAGINGDVSVFVYDDADVILDVNGYFAPPTTGGLSLYTTTPCRILDTRNAAGAFTGVLTVPISSSACALPSAAQANVLNATVVPSKSLNYLTLWPDGAAQPNVSTLNADDRAITSNMAIVPTSNGSIDAFASDPTQLILDVSSYFAPSASTGLATPVITSAAPTQFTAGSAATTIMVYGTNMVASSVVQWNGVALSTTVYGDELLATVPAADLAAAGTASVTVNTPGANPSTSNAVAVSITNSANQTLTSISPNSGPVNTPTSVTLTGLGFTAASTAAVNGVNIPCTFVSLTQMNCQIPASSLALPGNASISVTTPQPFGGTTPPLPFTAYLGITNNDIVYNPKDGLIYASVPVFAISSGGNAVFGIDPVTGNIIRQIWVGSNPNKLALSTDDTQLFVGIDGAAAVAQVDLNKGIFVNQFSLGGGQGVYNPPYTANYLAAVPGSPNSVAVATGGYYGNGNGVTIFDSGVPRANSSTSFGGGPLTFGASSSILYMCNGSNVYQLTVDSTGITNAVSFASDNGQVNTIQYDAGRLYLSTGQVFNSTTGAQLGTFYSGTYPANGPIVSDSTLGRAFVGTNNFDSSAQVLAFDEATFNSAGSIPIYGVGNAGYPTTFSKIVRWGQNGLALTAAASPFSSTNQLFILQSPLVEDLSGSPADLSVALTAPPTAATGTAISWNARVSNNGPNQSQGATLTMDLDSSLIINSVTPSQGSCGAGPQFTCNFGNLANGASATLAVSATPTISGTLAGVAVISSISFDPATTNNQAATNTVVSGSLYGAQPSISAISPSLVQAGSPDITLTVTGAGFNESSIVNLGSTALATTYLSATQLTAIVTAAELVNYGWASITVANPAPGGGSSQALPLTIFAQINVPASALVFDPYSQLLYASIPSTSTAIPGNSIVTIDPISGATGTPLFVGSQPTVMTETTDGDYLFVGLSGSDSLAQVDLLHHNVKATIPLTVSQPGATGGVAATWLAPMPGSDSTLAIDFTGIWGNFGIFDISGNTGSFRSNLSGIYSGVNPIFGSATEVYAFDSQTSGAELYRYSVDANGLNLVDGTTLEGLNGYGGFLQLADGLVYGAGGGIINPLTTPPSQVATLPFVSNFNSSLSGEGAGFIVDPSLQTEFVMLENVAGNGADALLRYDLTTYTPEILMNLPASDSNVEGGWTILRFGQDGLALLASFEDSEGQPASFVILLRGPFVTPQLLTTGTAAALASSSSSAISHGSGNMLLTLTGTNLLPGVAVTWNGSYRTTTWLDSTHATVAIPASDLAGAGTASLTATNPGASSSNALHITIN